MYSRQDLRAALERAARYGAYSRSAVERILAVTATPKPRLDKLAEEETRQLRLLLDEEPIRPRTGKEYGDLFQNLPSETHPDERRIREAHFPGTHTLEHFDWAFNAAAIERLQIEELATGDFIRLLIIDGFGFDRIEREQSPQALNLLYKVIDRRNTKYSTALIMPDVQRRGVTERVIGLPDNQPQQGNLAEIALEGGGYHAGVEEKDGPDHLGGRTHPDQSAADQPQYDQLGHRGAQRCCHLAG